MDVGIAFAIGLMSGAGALAFGLGVFATLERRHVRSVRPAEVDEVWELRRAAAVLMSAWRAYGVRCGYLVTEENVHQAYGFIMNVSYRLARQDAFVTPGRLAQELEKHG